jgi:hypothetical protein
MIAALLAAALTGPLAPAASGMVQCVAPNIDRRVCGAITRFMTTSDGRLESWSESLVSASPVIIMRMHASERIDGAADCSRITGSDIDLASFLLDGRPMPPAEALELRRDVRGSMIEIVDREVCTRFTPGPDGALTTDVTINGVPTPDMRMTVIWLPADNDYKVAP